MTSLLTLSFIALVGTVIATLLGIYGFGRYLPRVAAPESRSLPPGDDAPLDRLIAPALAAHPGESGMLLLSTNLDAFAARAISAREARRSLDLQYYIWDDDLTGRLLAHEVLKAADRGVRVRLLMDDINAYGRDRAFLALDEHPNISVKLFNPSRNRDDNLKRGIEMMLRAFKITRRMHNKAWIVDGRLAIVGGRNVGDAYYDADKTSNFCDVDLLVIGPAVDQAASLFDAYWNSRTAVPIKAFRKARRARIAPLRQSLEDTATHPHAKPYLERLTPPADLGDFARENKTIYWSKEARVLADPPQKVRGEKEDNWLMPTVRPVILSAERQVQIISPYFIAGRDGSRLMMELVARGIDLSVLTNSLAATDVAAVHGAYACYRRRLLKGGVTLFELKPYARRSAISLLGSGNASLHTKAFLVDGRIGFVGSMNFDPRSVSLNTEMGILFANPALVRKIQDIFEDETSAEKSYRPFLDGPVLKWRDQTGTGEKIHWMEPNAGFLRRVTAKLTGWLPVESQL